MPIAVRLGLLGAISLIAFSQTGCNMVPRNQLANAQNRTRQLYGQNKSLATDRQGLLSQNQQLQQANADLKARGDTLQQRVDNLLAERGQFSNVKHTNPLSDASNRQFQDLAKRYPDFDFDPQTGASKINNDILFESGKDTLRPEAEQLLAEFARILNNGDSSQLSVLVVGHTDDRPVTNPTTLAKHRDNWGLSCDRATSVVRNLQKHGVKGPRLQAKGYGPYQPRVSQKTDEARRQNRRVEIYVLAPDAAVAGFDTGASQK